MATDWARIYPTSIAGVDLLHAHFVQHSFDRHSHETWSISVTFAGRQTFKCRGTIATSIRENIIVFRPDEAHDGYGQDDQGFQYAMFYIPDAHIMQWLSESGEKFSFADFKNVLIKDKHVGQLLTFAAEAALQPQESLRSATLLCNATLELFTRHAHHQPHTTKRETAAIWLSTVREYLEAHFASDITVNELAALAGVSRVHLTRAFTAVYQLAPHAYLNQLRLRAAKRRLAQGEAISQAAYAAGFADQSHFTRRFKSIYGVTPGVWVAATKLNH